MSTSAKQNVSSMFRNVNSHQRMHISGQYGIAVAHDSPICYASESLVIHAENINSLLKPTVRSEFSVIGKNCFVVTPVHSQNVSMFSIP